MLGRRNLRIKVLQELYSFKMDEATPLSLLQNHLDSMVEKFIILNLVNHAYLRAICAYSDTDFQIKSARLIKQKDEVFSNRLSLNAAVDMITSYPAFKDGEKKYKIHNYIDEVIVKNIFQQLSKSDIYQSYIQKSSVTLADDIQILVYILENFMACSEDMQNHLEASFPNFSDDNDFILNTIHKNLKSSKEMNPASFFPVPDTLKEEKEFGTELLSRTYKNNQLLETLIKPCVMNWDIERIAVMDLIIIKMAACELKFFPTIPIKVTMNEYIDVAKYYSTPKSKDFVNGVMDKLKTQMTNAGEIKKTGRGLVDN